MIQFGTDGVRGPAGQWPVDEAGAARIGDAAAHLAGEGARVVVARDTRPSGESLARAVCESIAAAGGVALDAGVLPTPAVALAVARGEASAGVVVTASHNPSSDNGFKLFAPGGSKLTDEQTALVEAWLAAPPSRREGGSVVAAPQITALYLEALRAVAAVDLSGRRFAVDVANGAASPLAGALSALCGATVVPVASGDGPINHGCGATHPERLAETVRLQGLDGGFALDGDGDRCVLVTEAGDVVPGDALTVVLARARQVRGLAVTVMSTGALEHMLPGVSVVRTAVGDKHLQAAMRGHGLPLGAEESGHVLFDDWPGGDGLLTGLRALAACWDTQDTLSAALADYRAFPRSLTQVRVAERPPLASVPGYAGRVATWEAALGGGRVFLRYSGTEPVLRVLVEGPDATVVRAVAAEVEAWAHEALL